MLTALRCQAYIHAASKIFITRLNSVLYTELCASEHRDTMREVAWHEGDVVRKLRQSAGWKLKDLVAKSGVDLSVIHDLEIGRTKEAKRDTLQRLARAFGLTREDLEALVPKQPVRLEIPETAVRRKRLGEVTAVTKNRHRAGS